MNSASSLISQEMPRQTYPRIKPKPPVNPEVWAFRLIYKSNRGNTLGGAIFKSMHDINLTYFFSILINDFVCFTNIKKLCIICGKR